MLASTPQLAQADLDAAKLLHASLTQVEPLSDGEQLRFVEQPSDGPMGAGERESRMAQDFHSCGSRFAMRARRSAAVGVAGELHHFVHVAGEGARRGFEAAVRGLHAHTQRLFGA